MKITKKMNWVKYLVFISIIVGTPTIVRAELEDIFSKLKAYITVQEEYSSNIDLSHIIKKDDFITTVSPGLRLSTSQKSPITGEFRQAPTAEGRFGIDLDFNGGFNFYAKEHENNFISLNGIFNGWYTLSPRLNFRVRDYLFRSDEIREPDYSPTAIQGEDLLSRTNKRAPYIRNVFGPSLQYQFGREDSFAISYQNNVYHIQSATGDNSVENSINSTLTHWFNIRNGVSFQYGLTLGNFQRSSDLVGHMAMGRYTYRFNPNTSIFGEYTQLWCNFDPPSIDYTVYTPSLGIKHTFSPTLSGEARLGYFWQNPEKGSTTAGFSYDVNLTQRLEKTTYTLSSQGGYAEDYFTSQNLGFTKYYRAIGRINHQVLQKMFVGLFSSYEWAKIGGIERDQIWSIGGNASYQILRWLKASLNVLHQENHSNIPDRDYREYRGMFSVTANY